jgi:hypothetical protein
MADRFRLDGRSDDLDAAIEVIRGIRAEGMESRVDQAGLAANYARLLQLRYAVTGGMDDLDEAVDVARGALGDALEDAHMLMILRLNAGCSAEPVRAEQGHDRSRRRDRGTDGRVATAPEGLRTAPAWTPTSASPTAHGPGAGTTVGRTWTDP